MKVQANPENLEKVRGKKGKCQKGAVGTIYGLNEKKPGVFVFIGITDNGKLWQSKNPEILED